MTGDKPGRGRLLDNGLDDIFTVKAPGLPQERFHAVVVVVWTVHEVRRIEAIGVQRNGLRIRPAGEGAGCHLNVCFGIIPHAHREQFEQFTPVVLVGGIFMVF